MMALALAGFIRKFEVRKAADGQFYAVALAGNGKTVWLTETMKDWRSVHHAVSRTWAQLSVAEHSARGKAIPIPYTKASLVCVSGTVAFLRPSV